MFHRIFWIKIKEYIKKYKYILHQSIISFYYNNKIYYNNSELK